MRVTGNVEAVKELIRQKGRPYLNALKEIEAEAAKFFGPRFRGLQAERSSPCACVLILCVVLARSVSLSEGMALYGKFRDEWLMPYRLKNPHIKNTVLAIRWEAKNGK